jgi:hypothetical protein
LEPFLPRLAQHNSKTSFYVAFSQGMRELGYVEGKDYRIERRFAGGDVHVGGMIEIGFSPARAVVRKENRPACATTGHQITSSSGSLLTMVTAMRGVRTAFAPTPQLGMNGLLAIRLNRR